jgi:hypothetical protein
MPPTITTRTITVHMRRKKRGDKAEEFWERVVQREAEPLREALAAWIGDTGEAIWRSGTDDATQRGQPIPRDLGTASGYRRCRRWTQAEHRPPRSHAFRAGSRTATPSLPAYDSWPTCAQSSPTATPNG